MNVIIEFVRTEIIRTIVHNPRLFAFIGAFFAEEIILFLVIVAGRTVSHLLGIVSFAFVGFLIADSIWFLIGRSRIIDRIRDSEIINRNRATLTVAIKRFGMENPQKMKRLWPLIYTKFIYGTRIATIVYLGRKKVEYNKFLLYEIMGVLSWMIVMVPLAWLAGRGFSLLLHVTKDIELTITAIIILMILIFFVEKAIKRRFIRESEEKLRQTKTHK